MKLCQKLRRLICIAAVLAAAVSAAASEEAFLAEDQGLDLTELISIHYPVITGSEDKAKLKQINELIQEKCRIGEYLGRAAQLLSGGNLSVEWKGGIRGDIFSCAVSAAGTVDTFRNTYVWTAIALDLRNGREISFSDLFTDEEAAREQIRTYLEEKVAPELSAHLQNSELFPLPDFFRIEPAGLTLLYPIRQLSTLSDRAGDIRIGWHIVRDELDLSDDSVLSRIGAEDMISLSAESAEKLRETCEAGMLTDIPAGLGDSMQALTDRWHLLTDPDGFEDGRLFSLEGACFRGVYLMTDDLSRDWKESRVQGIRMDQGCLWGLCVGETPRSEWISELGEPDASLEIGAEKAEAIRLVPGICDYYHYGENQLRLYSDEEGTLVSVVLTE